MNLMWKLLMRFFMYTIIIFLGSGCPWIGFVPMGSTTASSFILLRVNQGEANNTALTIERNLLRTIITLNHQKLIALRNIW